MSRLLTEADQQLLPLAVRARGGFHLATRWYCRGWDPLPYQYAFHQCLVPNVSFLAGIAAGKTTTIAASFLIDCLTIPYFKALNTSVTAKQAELPFNMVMGWVEGNGRLEHLIDDVILRPYPLVKFKNFSEWVFRTAGKDAKFIRGHEYDRINYDEAGLDVDGEAVKVLRGRLRGVRIDGTHRMGRLDVITSPTDAPWLRERFERGWKENSNADLAQYFSMRVSTYMNTRLRPEDIRLMEAEYSEDMIDVELRGMFPDYGMSMFPEAHLRACTDQSLYDACYEALYPEEGKPKKGYKLEEHPRYGTLHFELPDDPGKVYVMAGDPGTDGPPRRNAPVVAVADVTEKPHRLVYLDWINGRGSYNPFLASYKYAIDKYRPILRGLDTTGTQKAIDELAFENHGIAVDGINFQRDKEAMLNSLIAAVTNHEWSWPPIRGLQRQMASYNRDNDKKIPQDIVMTLAELAYLARHVSEGGAGAEGSFVPDPRSRRLRTNLRRQRR